MSAEHHANRRAMAKAAPPFDNRSGPHKRIGAAMLALGVDVGPLKYDEAKGHIADKLEQLVEILKRGAKP